MKNLGIYIFYVSCFMAATSNANANANASNFIPNIQLKEEVIEVEDNPNLPYICQRSHAVFGDQSGVKILKPVIKTIQNVYVYIDANKKLIREPISGFHKVNEYSLVVDSIFKNDDSADFYCNSQLELFNKK